MASLEDLESAFAEAKERFKASRRLASERHRTPVLRLRAAVRSIVRGAPVWVPDVASIADPWSALAEDADVERDAALQALAVERQRAIAAEARSEGFAETARRYAEIAGRLAATLPDATPEALAGSVAGESTTLDYARWLRTRERSPEHLRAHRDMANATGAVATVFSVVIPVYKVPIDVLQDTIESVRRQTYPHWQLCIVHAYPDDAAGRSYLRECAAADSRVALREIDNLGISGNSNVALECAEGDYVVLLDHDDIIVDHALSAFAQYIRNHPEVDFLYSDKDMTDASGRERKHPLFKPAWSPEMMLTVNYLTHLNALRTSTLRAIDGWRSVTDGAQDWDLFLRFIESGAIVGNIPDVLYRWRMIETSVASGGISVKPYALAAQVRTIEESLQRRGVRASVSVDDADGMTLRPRWETLPERVTLIVIGVDDDEAWAFAISLADSASVRVSEILVPVTVVPVGDGPALVRAVVSESAFDARARLRSGFDAASNDVCVVIDSGTRPEGDAWLDDLVGPLAIPGVALVGPKVLEEGRDVIAHAGIVFDADGSLVPLFRGGNHQAYSLMGSAHWFRNVTAVDGGLFAVYRDTAREALDVPARHGRIDVQLALAIDNVGLRVVYTPFVRAREYAEPVLARETWPPGASQAVVSRLFADGDPRFHPQLAASGAGMAFRLPPAAAKPYDYAGEAAALSSFFLGPAETEPSETASGQWQSVMWVLPEFTHAFYGGVATILRFAAYLATRGVRSTFVVPGFTPPDVLRSRVVSAFPQLEDAEFAAVRNFEEMRALPSCDAGIATLWTTAYYVSYAPVARRYYFVQDAEQQFYPAGSTSALVEATYRFGFTAICNTVTLAEMARSYGGRAVHFTPAIDPLVFHDHGRPERIGRKRLFAYARPGHARNAFELLTASLRRVKEAMGDDVDIVTAGAPWSPAAYGLGDVLTNLGLLGYAETGDLYRSCDAGAVMMMTSHPSYLPMELMACGAAVVTNVNPRTSWLLKDGENAFLGETTVSRFADRIVDALSNDAERDRVVRRSAEFVRVERSDWDGEWHRLTEQLWK